MSKNQSSLDNAVAAGMWGLISAFSLVIGAIIGVSFKVSHGVNGLIMAFGAGALLFAVAIEMFAAGLREVDRGEDESSMHVLVGASIVGALFFTYVNRCLTGGKPEQHGSGHEESQVSQKGDHANSEVSGDANARNVAFSIWLGILIDGIPESMLIGFMQSEGELSVAFIVAVFLANFPEAMSASQIMYRNGDSLGKILCMWTVLCIGTGAVAFLTALVFPGRCEVLKDGQTECKFPSTINFIASASEGLAGGAMLACISTAMLPEAYEEGGDFTGVFTLLGFLGALWVKLSFEATSEPGAICSNECPT